MKGKEIHIPVGNVELEGELIIPAKAKGLSANKLVLPDSRADILVRALRTGMFCSGSIDALHFSRL